jgi:two-component system, chemotaxis family, protein-glutamate methylesterase/glutaminase
MKRSTISDFTRVVVADDSPFICRLLTHYLESDPSIKVVTIVQNGKDALKAVRELKPDVLTLDLNMPVLNGFGALKKIMVEYPTSVILISGVSKKAAHMTRYGLELGAVDYILKYIPGKAIPPDCLRSEIIAKVKAAAMVKAIIPNPSVYPDPVNKPITDKKLAVLGPDTARVSAANRELSHLIVIGASTGGPLAIKELLLFLSSDFFFPIVIVQHMPDRFTAILANQLNQQFPFCVREASQGEYLAPGVILVAPGNRHLLICPDRSINLTMKPAVNGYRPSIDVTMESAARVYGLHVTGILLSGMGTDGAKGLAAIKQNYGATYAQSKETCAIDVMPYTAIKKGVVQQVGSPADIARWLNEGFKRH